MTSADPGAPGCDAVHAELDAWLDGEIGGALDRRQLAWLDDHVTQCAACAAAVSHGRAYRDAMLRTASGARAPESLRARVRALFAGDAGSSSA